MDSRPVVVIDRARELDLLERALRGDRHAFDELAQGYSSSIRSMLISRNVSSADAQDILQETFIKAYVNLEKFNPEYTFGQWIYTIARNLFIDFTRRRRDDFLDVDGSDTPCTTPNPEQSVINEQNGRQLLDALERMPRNYRRMIELRFYSDLSYEEISQRLGMPMGTVKTQIHRAREKFIKELGILHYD